MSRASRPPGVGSKTGVVHPDLTALAATRLGVFTAREAVRVGYRPDEIRSELSSGRWRWLRRGVYVRAVDLARVESDARLRHLVDGVAVLLSLAPGPVLSHTSAAKIHRLVIPGDVDGAVRLTHSRQWRRGRGYVVTRASLPDADLTRVLAFAATSPARTLVDCAREWSVLDAVVAMDAALHAGLVDREDLRAAVLRATHWIGIGDAARAFGLADGRAESPLESRGRVALLEAGLPRPELQVEIHGPRGFVARVDAWYEEAGVAIEFDGRVKYLDPVDGRDPGEVLWREKRREDRLRELGVRVIRLAQEDVTPRRRRELTARVGALLAEPMDGIRSFRVVRPVDPGRGDSAVAASS
jgi:predicted transcriptional regulator of viral defense system